jgi:hypothetical protein
MHDCALRYDDTREGQLGDILFFDDVVDVGIFGSKTDPLSLGQTAQMPRGVSSGSDGPSGCDALVDTIRQGLLRLAALPLAVIQSTGARLQATHPADSAGPEVISTWPAELLALARPLYEQGLRVHLLPYYGPWMWEPIDAEFDLSLSRSTAQFQRSAQAAFRAAGKAVPRLGSHSFRRGRAAELFHGGLAPPHLSRVLRHHSPMSALPYVPEAARVTAVGAAMRAATSRSARISRAHYAGARRRAPQPCREDPFAGPLPI